MRAPLSRAGENSEVLARSLYEASYIEALAYKWIRSEQAGRDLGEGAIAEWLRRHWKGWCRERWIEHLRGEVFWKEFGRGAFGALERVCGDSHPLLSEVLDRVRHGCENLDIILWATESGLDVSAVIDILVIVDVNRPRLDRSSLMAESAF